MRYANLILLLWALATGIAHAEFTVKPEKSTQVALSNLDVNRIVCESGNITDIFYSEEKGVVVQAKGSDAFVKLKMKRRASTGELIRPVMNVDLHVVCAGQVYTLIGALKPIPTQTIRLVAGKKNAKKNIKMLGAMPFEKRIGWIMRAAYRNEYPDSFVIKMNREPYAELGNLFVDRVKVIRIEGLGLKLTEYEARSSADSNDHLRETDFLQPQFGKHIAAISIDSDKGQLSEGEKIRVFIIERVIAQ